ncbi:TetR/AcrR family transcriptional regulator [Mesorhizobium amorphae]|uniref:TetR/AcrR family transcriptional regulator n=1 Tax=Mesorhizobium amorphae TaxID=71433 RepID=UPI0011129DA4|nr:TetR/AcrR family transcriptional regulator [Mesorhizobium amorphae]
MYAADHSFLGALPTHVNISDHMSLPKEGQRRSYRLQRRAVKQAETHLALARAAFELHSSVGPSRTTVSAIAEKAGVQRLTVYRHFPDEEAVFSACSAYSFGQDPPPNPEVWRSIADPDARLRTALLQLYGYYSRKRQLLANLYRDAEMPVVAAALVRRREVLAKGVTILESGWLDPDSETARLLVAAIGHALDFSTWRSLVENQGLSEDEAVEAMLVLIRCVSSSSADCRAEKPSA